jgi:glycosyltransferase involved in cell wall biosynthesis
MRPVFITPYIQKHLNKKNTADTIKSIKTSYQNLLKGDPEISIVIPAYNEENTILPTLSSLCDNKTSYSVEIVVVNNNSKDDTENLVKACGITCILETKQGIVFARNAGLPVARGKYILNADADSIYPEKWIDEMVKPLIKHEVVAVTYGPFSFIPVGNTGRLTYFFYEHLADLSRLYDKYVKDEAVNVYGFTSAMRRDQALAVDGFTFPKGAGEDGYLALKLRDQGFGKLYRITSSKAIVWTTDRRIQIDGGLFKGLIKRIKRVLNIK